MKLNKKIFLSINFIISINCSAQFFANFNAVKISQEILSENTLVINDLDNQKILVGCNHITLNESLGLMAYLMLLVINLMMVALHG